MLIVPGLIVYTFYKKQIKTSLKDTRIWRGISFSLIIISGFYIARELTEPGYLKAVWHNELFPRYLNQSDRYQYNQTDFWYYYNELKNWQFAYWFPFIIPSFIISISCYERNLRNLVIFFSIQIIFFYVIISKGSSNVWYDLLLIPLFAIIIGMAIYKVFELIYLKLNLNKLKVTLIFLGLFTYIFFDPYQKIIQKDLNNDETSAQVMYAYAFKRIEKSKPKLKAFKIYEPIGYNYPLVFYKNIYNQTKGYKIENINDQELVNYNGYMLILNEQLSNFEKNHLDFKIHLKDPFYALIEL
jgi:hypothetical protein